MIDEILKFPGAELILPGLEDLAAGRLTVPACLVSIARPIIERSGLAAVFGQLHYVAEPERALYRILCEERTDAYGRYNSLLRRLVSFERALRRAVPRTVSEGSG